MKYLFSRGELRRRREITNLWGSGELVLDTPTTPEGDEPFVEIRIVTLKAALETQAIDAAMEQGADLSNLSERVHMLLHTTMTTAKEFIEVTPDYIRVGVNRDLIDDSVIADVWELLSRQGDLSPDTKLEFGELVQVYENKNYVDKRLH